MSGYAIGFFLAALAYALLGGNGWRLMLGIAVVPALLVWFIRRYVPEPAEITADHRRPPRPQASRARPSTQDRFVLRRLLSPPLLRRTLVCTALATGSLIAFWSVSTWYPQIIRQAAAAASAVAGGRQRPRRRSPPCSSTPAASSATRPGASSPTPSAGGRPSRSASRCPPSAWPTCSRSTAAYTSSWSPCPIAGFGLFGALSGNPSSTGRSCSRPASAPPASPSTTASAATSPPAARWSPASRRFLVRRGPRAGHHLRRRLRDARPWSAAVRPRDPRRRPADRPGRHDHHHRHDHRGGTGMSRYDGATAAVIGGSIGGLTTALLLRDLGLLRAGLRAHPHRARRARRRDRAAARHGALVHRAQQPAPGRCHLHRVGAVPRRRRPRDRHRDQRTWTYTSWGTFYRALLADFGTAELPPRRVRLRLRPGRAVRDRAVRQRPDGDRGPGRLRRRHHLDGPRAARPDRAAHLLRLRRLARHGPRARAHRRHPRAARRRDHLQRRAELAHHALPDPGRGRRRADRRATG